MIDDSAPPVEDTPPPLSSGACPLCEAEFDDRAQFREHLRDAHDLVDDEGTETDFIPPFLSPPVEMVSPLALKPPAAIAAAAAAAAPARPAPPAPDVDTGEHRRRTGLIVLGIVALLALIGGAMVLAMGGGDDPSFVGLDDGTGNADLAVNSDSVPPPLSDGAPADAAVEPSADASAAGDSHLGAAAPTAQEQAGEPAPAEVPPPTETPTTAPQPPAPFSAPTTTGAKVDGCARDHGRWMVTYSWQFVGGASWSTPSGYRALNGGRYQHSMLLKSGSTITTVQVVDPNGALHTITLNPALSTASC